MVHCDFLKIMIWLSKNSRAQKYGLESALTKTLKKPKYICINIAAWASLSQSGSNVDWTDFHRMFGLF